MSRYQAMNEDRIITEARALADLCPAVDFDLTTGEIMLYDFPLPTGWNQDRTRLWFQLPEEYPATQPDAYLPADLRYQDKKPYVLLFGRGPDDWAQHCIHELHDWEPRRHTLVTLTRMIATSLSQPNSSNPLEQT
ncbi:hypothetical protein [Natrinema sp. SYSU A 869]|uniref:hypothetical protein n=1 Tax=Natrinema sp. SYSU A 869 TaxID=2871694 RepID=UPI001CA431F8|nr:hypothetical protein [Natrinema sp. SYSU A 869]